MSVKSNSFQPCRASEICFTLTIIAVRRPLIIKYSSTYHSLLVVGVYGVWGDGNEFPPRRLSPSRLARMIACVLLSPSPVREFGFPVEVFPWSFSRGIFLMEFSSGDFRSHGEWVPFSCGVLSQGAPDTSPFERLGSC